MGKRGEVMGLTEILLTAAGLSMDAFSAAVCKGTASRGRVIITALFTALMFGAFQAIMPLTGYILGSGFMSQLEKYDHWTAFILLAVLGVKMIIDARSENESSGGIAFPELLMLSVATSIDAMAVGLVFAANGTAPLFPSFVIGAVTFAVSFAGVLIGRKFGSDAGSKAETAGGAVLILIGVKLLLEGIK